MHRHEDAVDAKKRQPEMPFAQRFAHHAAEHFRKPEIGSGKNTEQRRNCHHEVKVSYDEICRVKISVERSMREVEAADPPADEDGNESEAEQRRRVESHFRAVERSCEQQRHNRRGYGDDQGGHRKNIRGERIHAAHKHVMAPYHVAEKSDRNHASDKRLRTEKRPAREDGQNRCDDANRRQDGDVDFGMTEKPEEMLPEQRRAAGMRLQFVAEHESSGNEKASASDTIQN